MPERDPRSRPRCSADTAGWRAIVSQSLPSLARPKGSIVATSAGHRIRWFASPMDDDHIEKWRQQERRRLLAERLALGRERHRRWSAMIEERLSLLLDELPGTVIGLYWPVKGEFDARPLAAHLREQGRATALPAVIERGRGLEYRSWDGETAMAEGIYRIPVPSERRLVDPAIVIVPLLGFDAANYRLGYGGG